MTTELRDRLAWLCGWKWHDIYTVKFLGVGAWRHDDGTERVGQQGHPFPPGDLTALAAVWPEDKNLWLEYCPRRRVWIASSGDYRNRSEAFQGDNPFNPLIRLTIAVLESERRQP